MALSAATAFAGWAAASHADTFGANGTLTTLNVAGAWHDETGALSGPPGSGDLAQFDSGTALTATTTFTLGANTTWAGLSVTNPSLAVLIGGGTDASNTLTLASSGVNMSAATQSLTLSDALVLGTAETINVGTGATFTESITSTLNGNLTFAGAGNATFTGVINGGSNNIIVNSTGTVTLTAANAITGNTTVNSGTLAIGANSTGTGVNTSMGTGTLILAGGSVTFQGSSSGNNGFYNPIVVNSASTILSGTQLAGAITGSGQLNISDGTGNLSILATGAGGSILSGYTGLIELGTSSALFGFTDATGFSVITGGTFGLDLGTSTAYFANNNGTSATSATIDFGSLAGGSGTLLEGDRKNATHTTTFSIGGGTIQSTVFAGTIENGTANTATATTALILTAGTLALTGTNTFSGGTTISGGTLQIGNNTATGNMGTGAVSNNSVLVFNRSDTALSEANAISGSGSVINNGTGIVTLTGVNSYSGGTTINAGLLQADNATNALGTTTVAVNTGGGVGGIGTIQAPVTIASGGTLQPGDAGISHGAGAGVGTLTMTSLSLANSSVLNYTFSPASNSLANITTANGLTVAGTPGIDLVTAGATATPFDTNGTYNIFQFPSAYTAGSVSGLLNILDPQIGVTYTWGTSGNDITLTIAGGGSSTVWNKATGASWATGTDWTAGVPNSVGALATLGPVLGSSSNVTLDGNETVGNLVFNNGSASYTITQGSGGYLIVDNGGSAVTGFIYDTNGNHTISAPMTLNSNLQIGVSNASNTLTISGAIGGVGAITDSSSGLVILSGNNGYSGGTTILNGTLQIGTGGATGSLGTSTAAIANGGSLAFNLSSSLNVASAITGSGSVSMSGIGIVTLSGTDTYAGTTTITGGTLQVGNTAALSTGQLAFTGAGVLDLNGNSITLSTISGTTGKIDSSLLAGTPTLTISSGVTQSFGGVIADTQGALTLVKAGSGTLNLTGVNTYTGGTTISAGFIKVPASNNLGTGTITVGDALGLQLGTGVNISNTIALNGGSNEFEDVPDGGASATISGNIIEGSTGPQLRLGTSHVNSGTGLPDSTLTLTGAANAITQEVLFTKGNIIYAGSGSIVSTSTSPVVVGRSSSSSDMNLTIENNASITGVGVDVGGLDSTSDDLDTTLTIANNGSLSAGTGVFNLNNSLNKNANTLYAVSISMSGNANITAGSFTDLTTGIAPTTFTINGGSLTASANDPSATVKWFPLITNASNGAGTALTIQVGSSGVNINNGGFAITVAQPFAGGGGGFVNFLGSGTTTLAAASSYTGNDTVSAGTLSIADTSGSATGTGTTLTISPGATLASSPAVAGAMVSQNVLASGATVAPGGTLAFGTLTVGGLTTSSATTLSFDLGTGAGPTISNGDMLTLGSGTISVAAATQITLSGIPTVGDTYELIGGNIAGLTTGDFTVTNAPLSGQSYAVVDSGGFIGVTVNAGLVYTSNLIWNGTAAGHVNNGLFDTATSYNWNVGTLVTQFNAADNVTFNDNNGGNYAVTVNATVSPGSVTMSNSTGNYTISGTGKIADTGTLAKSGTGTVSVGAALSVAGTTNISAGTLAVATGGTVTTGATTVGGTLAVTGGTLNAGATSLTGVFSQSGGKATFAGINGAGSIAITGGTASLAVGSGQSSVGALTISGTGALDLVNNHLYINYGSGSDPISTVIGYIKSGYNGGGWNGPGIMSSAAQAPVGGLVYGIGYADSADLNNPANLAADQIEVKYTLLGDANLDGIVNAADFTILAANFNQPVTGWDQGDFNYDGLVNAADFTDLAANFNQSAGAAAVSAGDVAALDAFATANGLSLPTSSVPEPATTGLLALGAIGILARRRRRSM
ncbi:MAG: autotransporter-associated beta strand repeat-containing protein [Tepidisphaeraceae bacterium]